jgi:large subunit ribosomal protein L30
MKLAVIRVRGGVRAREAINKTLNYLRLDRVNHCVVVDDTSSNVGMIRKAKDYITWGTPSAASLSAMLRKRGRLVGDRPVTDAYVSESTEGRHATVESFAGAWASGAESLDALPDLKPVFRLHPPRKGHKGSVKQGVAVGGALGDRKERIDELIERMI